jgi:hypothetical protein
MFAAGVADSPWPFLVLSSIFDAKRFHFLFFLVLKIFALFFYTGFGNVVGLVWQER